VNSGGTKVERFEDLIAWQRAREVTKSIYTVTREGVLARDFGLADQMKRASVSIMANIAEGFERSRPGEFHQYLSMAKGSCGELRSHIYVAHDAQYIDIPTFRQLLQSVEELGRIIGGLRVAVERRRDAS
jgi:four helix bundle protein